MGVIGDVCQDCIWYDILEELGANDMAGIRFEAMALPSLDEINVNMQGLHLDDRGCILIYYMYTLIKYWIFLVWLYYMAVL